MVTGAYYSCGEQGHFRRECPRRKETGAPVSEATVQYSRAGAASATQGRGRGRGQMTGPAPSSSRQDTQGQRSQGQARVFAMTRQEAAEAPEVIVGKIYLFDTEVSALIDPGDTHSFIASNVASYLSVEPGLLNEQLSVRTPLGESLAVRTVYKDCLVRIDTGVFPVDVIVLSLLDLDIILGMDWLTRHRAMVNC